MNDMARGAIVGVLVAVVLAGGVVAVLDFTSAGKGRHPDRERPAKVKVVHIGPNDEPGSSFGDDVRNAVLRNSQRYDLCYADLRVQRPSVMTTQMPTAFCEVTRKGSKGPWRISTGGWQTCQAVCVKFGK
jgi:hypothetical protein